MLKTKRRERKEQRKIIVIMKRWSSSTAAAAAKKSKIKQVKWVARDINIIEPMRFSYTETLSLCWFVCLFVYLFAGLLASPPVLFAYSLILLCFLFWLESWSWRDEERERKIRQPCCFLCKLYTLKFGEYGLWQTKFHRGITVSIATTKTNYVNAQQ